MAQQPNIELTESDLPRRSAEPAAAHRWRPTKPGLITSPDEKPSGGAFGATGPDPGWALRLLSDYPLPDDDPDLKSVIAGLTMARAATLGRAAVREDIEASLILCGYGDNPPQSVVEQRERWLSAAPHDLRPGQTAVFEVDLDLLINKPDQIRFVLNHSEGARSESNSE